MRTSLFRLDTKTRKSIHTVVVSASAIVRNAYANNVQATLTLDDLFKE